ncbi:MAG: hypothetical protein JXN60_03680 [Lentisphaerae bacterium]|nr:hypothetical protein [Lentisphaerota bacterium]
MRAIRFAIGLALVPACIAVTNVVILLLQNIEPEDGGLVTKPILAMGGGFVIWLFLYFTLPKPIRTYILAHELTHALWAMLMDVEVVGMTISGERGSVTLSRTNFLITLAPYFFPFYTVLVVAGYGILSIFYDLSDYHLIMLGLVGFTWGFHLTFTVATLMQKQTDIQECGHLFSYAVIYIFNIVGIGLWIVMVSSATLEDMVAYTLKSVAFSTALLRNILETIIYKIRQ